MLIKFLSHRIKKSPFLCRFFRVKHSPFDYLKHDRLYRGFKKVDVCENTDTIQINAIKFPDFSCNWSRYAKPESVRDRIGGKPGDGCYSFTVEVSQFGNMATTCHDPLPKNYSHSEVRQLTEIESIYYEPPKNRKLESKNWSKSKRQVYRQNLINNLKIEFLPVS